MTAAVTIAASCPDCTLDVRFDLAGQVERCQAETTRHDTNAAIYAAAYGRLEAAVEVALDRLARCPHAGANDG